MYCLSCCCAIKALKINFKKTSTPQRLLLEKTNTIHQYFRKFEHSGSKFSLNLNGSFCFYNYSSVFSNCSQGGFNHWIKLKCVTFQINAIGAAYFSIFFPVKKKINKNILILQEVNNKTTDTLPISYSYLAVQLIANTCSNESRKDDIST